MVATDTELLLRAIREGFHSEGGVRYRTLDFLGFPGYRVGDDGSVWTCWLSKGLGKAPGGRGRGWKMVLSTSWKKMKPQTNHNGYLCIALRRNGSGKCLLIHRLVLCAFVGHAPEGLESAHNNGKRNDSRLANLRWETKAGNMADKIKHGTHGRGERNPRHKLDEEEVIEIRKSYRRGGVSYAQLAEIYGVKAPAIFKIVSRKTWKHLSRKLEQ